MRTIRRSIVPFVAVVAVTMAGCTSGGSGPRDGLAAAATRLGVCYESLTDSADPAATPSGRTLHPDPLAPPTDADWGPSLLCVDADGDVGVAFRAADTGTGVGTRPVFDVVGLPAQGVQLRRAAALSDESRAWRGNWLRTASTGWRARGCRPCSPRPAVSMAHGSVWVRAPCLPSPP